MLPSFEGRYAATSEPAPAQAGDDGGENGETPMSREDQGAGPQFGQMVLYNNSGTTVPGVINQINSNGTVGIYAFIPAGAAQQSNVSFSASGGSGGWWYPAFL
jgi:hypothetical protein